jgi:hypothetical protein
MRLTDEWMDVLWIITVELVYIFNYVYSEYDTPIATNRLNSVFHIL